jgi:plastocyanin
MRRAILVLTLLFAAGTALSGCLGDPIDPNEGLSEGHNEHHDETSPLEELGAPDVVLEAHAGLAEEELTLHPSPLKVPLGSVVEIRVENQGSAPHTFTIHQFDADTGVLNPGESKAIKFRADEAGTFEIMCDVPGHYQSGMKATLEVAA